MSRSSIGQSISFAYGLSGLISSATDSASGSTERRIAETGSGPDRLEKVRSEWGEACFGGIVLPRTARQNNGTPHTACVPSTRPMVDT